MRVLRRVPVGTAAVLGLVLAAGTAAPASAARLARSGASPAAAAETVQASPGAGPHGQGDTPVGYGPAQLQNAYDLPSASAGMLQTVAVVAPYDDPDVVADLAAYRSYYKLPPCAPDGTGLTGVACFTEYNEDGLPIPPNAPPGGDTTWALQTSAQLDAISAVCPNCRLMLVETQSASLSDIGTGAATAISHGASAVTIGVAAAESSADIGYDTDYFENTKGVAITAAAGDAGYQNPGSPLGYPAASQYVTAVGGTTLDPVGSGGCTKAKAAGRGWCEKAWNDLSSTLLPQGTESGCSLYEPQPSWQAATVGTGCAGFRTVTDLAADADPSTGLAVYDTDGSGNGTGWQQTATGGTSVAAAIIAGVYALAGTPAAGTYPASYPYQDPDTLNDVTTGNDLPPSPSSCTPRYLCVARAGYDGPTGLGTPDGTLSFTSTGSTTGALYNGITDMCADDTNYRSTNGTKIQIYQCDAAQSQVWTVESNGTIDINGGCLDNTGGVAKDGNPIQLYQCVSGDKNQQWIPQPDGEIVNTGTGMCLDNYDVAKTDGGTKNGTQLDVWTCNANPNQQWTLPYSDPIGLDRIISAYSPSPAMCLDDYFNKYTNGNPIDAHSCDDNAKAQAWTVAADGTLQIGGSCVDVYQSGVTDGTKVQLYACTGGTNQEWRVLSDGAIVGLGSGSCLAEGDTTSSGMQLTISACDPQDSGQRWLFGPYQNTYRLRGARRG